MPFRIQLWQPTTFSDLCLQQLFQLGQMQLKYVDMKMAELWLAAVFLELLAGCSERAQMEQLAQSSWLEPRVKALAPEGGGCALGVATEPRMEPARLVASFAPDAWLRC